MGVFDQSLAAELWWGAHMAGLLDGSAAAYAGLALATDDLDSDIERLRGQGASISDPVAGERARPDGDVVRWRIGRLPEPDPDLGLVFLIEHDTSSAEWRPADREARAGQVHAVGTSGRLARVEMPVPEAGATTLRLLRRLGLQFRPIARRSRRARHDDRQPAASSHSLGGRPHADDRDPRRPRAQGGRAARLSLGGRPDLADRPDLRTMKSIFQR